MRSTATYTLEEFVQDLREGFASHADLVGRANAVAAVLEAHGIKVEVFGDTGYSVAVNFTEARLLVPEGSAQAARDLINKAEN